MNVALLRHLEIEHVSVASHSGGTIYALDFVLNYPEILHPERPYLAIGAPWILPSHTSSATMRMAQLLPASIIDHTDKFVSLINNYISPAVAASVGLSQPVIHKLAPPRPESASDVRDGEDNDGIRFEEELLQDIINHIYTESTKGISDDAVLFMQKNEGVWGDWGDYDTLVPRLEQALRTAGRRLSIDVFFAENDFMVGDGGTKGTLWFDQCWDLQHEDGPIKYRSTIVRGADHNEIWNLRWGAAQVVLNRISPSVPDSSS